MSEIVLVIPEPPPPSINRQERMHWADRRRLRKYWAEQAYYTWYAAGRPRFRHPDVLVRFVYAANRKHDSDNAGAMVKPLLDGLKNRAFGDDDAASISLLPVEFAVDKDKPRVEIILRGEEEGSA